jgi:DNA-binding CsgD family transcriptional regulator
MVRALLVTALVFVQSYWIPMLVLVPFLSAQTGLGLLLPFHVLVTLVYVGMTSLFQYQAPRAAKSGWLAVSLTLVGVGSGLIALTSGIKALVGGLLYVVGSYWLNVVAHASLADVDPDRYLIGMTLGFPVAAVGTLPLRAGMPGAAGAALGFAIALTLWFIVRPHVDAILKPYREHPAPHELSVANPGSFLPFTSKFFVSLLLFQVMYSTLSNSGASVNIPMVVASLAVVAAVGLGWALHRTRPDADYLFQAAALFLVAGGIISVAIPQTGEPVAQGLASGGVSLAELVLYWYAVMVLGKRNVLALLPTLAWGRTALSLGAVLGTLGSSAVASWELWGEPATTLLRSVVLLGFVGYNLVALKRFDFGTLSYQTAPLVLVDARDPEAATRSEHAGRHVTSRYHLTPREAEISALLAHGRSYRFIEAELGLTRNTVKSHIRSIYSKLGVHSQQELIDLYDNADRAACSST